MTTASPSDPAFVLQIDSLRFGYESGDAVIRDFTAHLHPGQLCVLLGPNAAGKSTLLRLILGQLEPWSGCVLVDNHDVTKLKPSQRAAWISYVPQRAATRFAFTVRQVVEMGRHALPRDPQAVDHALQVNDLVAFQNHIYTHLSMGQQQRVLLARAMAQAAGQGRLMVLDEPVSALDLWHAHETMRRLLQLTHSGLTVLAVLHDLNLAARYADTVWIMDQGRLVACGPWQTVLQPSVLEPVYRVSLAALPVDEQGRPIFSVKIPPSNPDTLK